MSAAATAYRDLRMGRIFVYPAGKRQIELKFSTAAGVPGRVAVDFGDVSEFRLLQRQLRNAGYCGSAISRADALALDHHVVRYAQSPKGIKALTPVYSKGGWNARRTAFVLGDLELPAGREAPRPPSGDRPMYAVKGTMTGWKSSVAKLAAHSSRAMLMISAALAAPALAYAGIEAGGFGVNLWGGSSSGKTTALRVAASTMAGDFVGSWNGTALGLQDLACEYCDLPLTIDSLESVSGAAQRELSETVAYTLGNGKARIRAKSWLAADSAPNRAFRTVLLSTAETKHRRAQKTGAAVRLVDVPVARDPQNPLGIVDYIPTRIPADRHRAFAATVIERLKTGVADHHGHVLPAFVTYLAKNQKAARASLIAGHAEFLRRFGRSDLSNAEARVLGQFATIYAAGRLGIALGLLPWTEVHLLDAVRRCAADAADNSNDRAKRNEVCVSRAKARPPSRFAILKRIDELNADFDQTHISLPEGEFFELCFSHKTLAQIVFLRGQLAWRVDDVDCFIAAMAAGCLHGESHRSERVFSNRMPRTISTKPAYSVKWWRLHNCSPPDRDVFSILRAETDFRFESAPADKVGEVVEGDARESAALLAPWVGKVDQIITSPPYLDVTHFREDQWLRVWFLGGEPLPSTATNGDDRHSNEAHYWAFLAESWRGLAPLISSTARIVIRIGGRRVTQDSALAGLQKTLESAFKQVTCTDCSVSDIRNGQLRSFRPNAEGTRREFDFVFDVSGIAPRQAH